VSGRLEVLELPPHWAFRDLRHTPAEVRALMAERGWERVVAFQTRNPMHRAHQQLGVRAARDLDAHLLLNPVVGITKPGDVDPYVRVRCYRALLPTYPPGQVLLSLLPLAMRMAGPREALWHAIIRKNLGATHFIVGRDHAGPGVDSRGRPFYDPYAAQQLVQSHEAELGIGVVPFRQMVYVEELGQYVPEDEVRPGQHLLRISGTEQRRRLAEGEELPAWFTPPEVAAELRRAFPPRVQRGVAVLLPAALPEGDRVADGVAAELREAGRRVTVLDGAALAGDAEPLAVRLLGEVLGNGGALVVTGVEGTDELASRLAAQGFVVEVGIDRDDAALAAETEDRGPRLSRLLVPADGTAELLAGLVGDHLRRTGSLPTEPATPSLGDHVGSRSV
jgi:sulfate adenylyltransferase